MSVSIFFCYAHEDERLFTELKVYLSPLLRQGIINALHDRDISYSTEWEKEIDSHLNTAEIILLLISPDFMASDYCYSVEMKRALERHERKEAYVIPIILRPVYWQAAPFGKLQVLPSEGKPVTSPSWHSVDEALFNIVEGVRLVCEEFMQNPLTAFTPFQEPTSISIQQPLHAYRSLREKIEVFFCYAREDEQLRLQLEKHLRVLKQQGIIHTWSDREISHGVEWEKEIDSHLNTAEIILLLISPDFMASDYCYSVEMKRALERYERKEAYVIPIILRPVYWQAAPFGKLQVLPSEGKPVTSPSWHSVDEAFLNIAEGVRLVCEKFMQNPLTAFTPFQEPTSISIQQPLQTYQLYDVFVKSGVPHVTFVEREDFRRLKLSLAQPGRGVVIEGSSGVGKTTSLKKAIGELRVPSQGTRNNSTAVQMLSARNLQDRNKLQTLPNWHSGTVIIDDFHRLDPSARQEIADYLKHLADTEPETKKLVVVGIPQSGQALVDISFDVATRIDVFRWGKVKDDLIRQMIEKGEKALNIEFDRRAEIVLASSGSLNVAQFLCFNICEREEVLETQKQLRMIQCNTSAAIPEVITDLSRKFGESIRRFAALGGHRDTTCVNLLEELAQTNDGYLSLSILKGRRSDLARGIELFLSEKWMLELCREYPECMNHLFFDMTTQALVIDDPQLTFYLSKMQFSALAKEVGKAVAFQRQKVFISYSHKDERWLERLQTHLRPLEREGIIDLWDDTKIEAGANWREEIQVAIDSSIVAVVLVSANFLGSDFITEYEIPKILLRARAKGTIVLPLIVSPCLFIGSGLDVFQAVNSPDRPLVEMNAVERERTLVKLAGTINKRIAIGDS